MAIVGARDDHRRPQHLEACVGRADAGASVSIAFWFVALIGIQLRADSRTLHDLCAGTCVVYHWRRAVPRCHGCTRGLTGRESGVAQLLAAISK